MSNLKEHEIRNFYNDNYVSKLSKQTLKKNERLLRYIQFSKNDAVLDIGCGDGRLSHMIYDKIKTYEGIDFSASFINKANKIISNTSIKNVNFICGDIVDFCNEKSNFYDKIFALDISEHISDKDLIRIFSSVKNSLKEKGTLYIHTPNRNYFLEKMKEKGIIKQFPEHIAVRNDKENIIILNKCGFSKIKIKYIAHYVLLLKILHLLSFFPFIGKFFQARLFIIVNY